jgi:radical SAM superfamily enzyme YgiQ (UPF0313 family)
MRVLLVNSNRQRNPWPIVPFGLCCLATYLEDAGHEVRLLDLCFSTDPSRDAEISIRKFNPDAVGITIRNIDSLTLARQEFFLENVLRDVIAPIKKTFSGPIVIGGPAVGINGAEMLEYLDLEYAVQGDGEMAMAEFLRRLEQKESFLGIQGFVIRRNKKVIEENEPWRVEVLDSLPSPKLWDYIDIQAYRRFDSPIQIQTKRGCELSCTYCTYNIIEGKKYRLRNPRKVADEIEALANKTGVKHIEFTDSTFNIPLEYTKAVLRAIIAKNLKLNFRTMGLNPGAIDEELVILMRNAGFRDVDLGVESGSEKMLKSLGKSYQKTDIRHAGRLLHRYGIPVCWILLLGAPGESPDTLQETFDTLEEVVDPWDLVDIGVGLRVYKGSPIAKGLEKEDPEVTHDHFFNPFFLPLEGFEFSEFRRRVEMECSRHSNYHLFGSVLDVNPLLRRVAVAMMKTVAPRQPIWRFYILVRKLMRVFGFPSLRSRGAEA